MTSWWGEMTLPKAHIPYRESPIQTRENRDGFEALFIFVMTLHVPRFVAYLWHMCRRNKKNSEALKHLFYLKNPHTRSGARKYIRYILHGVRSYIHRSSRVRFFGLPSASIRPAERMQGNFVIFELRRNGIGHRRNIWRSFAFLCVKRRRTNRNRLWSGRNRQI